jgi:hypothetical protein
MKQYFVKMKFPTLFSLLEVLSTKLIKKKEQDCESSVLKCPLNISFVSSTETINHYLHMKYVSDNQMIYFIIRFLHRGNTSY